MSSTNPTKLVAGEGQKKTTTAATAAVEDNFTAYYLQQSTREFAEDLDKIRGADDFKGDALAMLLKSLKQGTSMFTTADQARIVDARNAAAEAGDGEGAGSRQERGGA